MDGRPTWTDCDEAGDYVVPNVLSPRDLVFRPDNMDETVPHTYTVQSAKRLYPPRLRTWNFASHVTFLRGFGEEVAWVLRGISVSFAKFCEFFFVEHGKQA